jgi:hypothetical protein
MSCVATGQRTIHLPEGSCTLLAAEAQRRGIDPDALADELVRADLGTPGEQDDLEVVLGALAELRSELREIDGIALARDARDALERRGS